MKRKKMTFGKKFFALAVVLSMMVGVASPSVAVADTADDLQAQITALQEQLSTLLGQLSDLEGDETPAATGEVPAECSGVSFDRNLKVGMTGDDVKCLQALLNTDEDTKLADSGAGSPGNETSYFGPITKAAVIKFQEKYADDVLASWGLTAGTGFAGSTTRAKLNEILASGVEEPEEEPEGEPGDYDTEADCEAAGYYWYDDVCNASAEEEEPVSGADLSVVLASDTQAVGAIYVDSSTLTGSSNAKVARITLTAGDEAVKVSKLVLTKYGTASNGATDISRVKVYDGATQLGSRVLVNDKATFTFTTLNLSANSEKTLDLMVDLAGSAASVTRTVALGIADAADVTATADGEAISATGTFPMAGNYMTIAEATFGSITVAAGVNPPTTTPRIGENDRVLANFIISTGANEDVVIESMTFTDAGTTVDGDITDIKLKSGTEVLGTLASFTSRKGVVALNKELSRGSSLSVQMTGDITAGVNNLLTLTLVQPDAVVARGITSGVYFTGPAANRAMPATAAFAGGALTVIPDTESPTDNLVTSTLPQTVGIYEFKVTGENVVVQQVVLTFAHSAAMSSAYNVALFNEDGGMVSDIQNVAAAGSAETFALSWTVSPGTTGKKMYVKAYTSALAAADAVAPKTITVSVAAAGITGIGEASAAAVTAPGTGFALPAVSYRHTGSLQLALNTTVAPINQAVLTSTANNYWTAFTTIATRENISITSIQFDNIAAATTSPFVTCSLYDRATDGTLTNLDTQAWTAAAAYPCIAGACGNVVFNNINSGAGITIPMSAANAKVLVVKCSVGGATATDAPELDVIANPTATGAASGTTITGFTLAGLVTGAQTRGLHTIFTPAAGGVLYVEPNTSAPSGTISRDSTATLGIWDLTAKGANIVILNAGAVKAMKFTSYTGGVQTLSANFRLVDATTNVVYASAIPAAQVTANSVQINGADFAGGNTLTILQDQTVTVKLQENITDTTAATGYAQYTTMQFGIAAAADVVSNAAAANVGGLVDYPASGLDAKCPEVKIQ